MSEMISFEYLMKFFSSNPVVCCQFKQNGIMWSLSLPSSLSFSSTDYKYEGTVMFLNDTLFFNVLVFLNEFIYRMNQDTLHLLRVLSAVMMQSGNLKRQQNVFQHVTVHMGLCLTVGVLLMAPVTLHCIPPRELDWCADTHSQQGADEDKTCSCLLEMPVVAWHRTKGRNRGLNFFYFILFLDKF